MARSCCSSPGCAWVPVMRDDSKSPSWSLTDRALQRQPDELLRGMCTGRDALEQAGCLGRLVLQRHQGIEGLAVRITGPARGRQTGGRRRRVHPVTHFDDQTLGGLAPDPGNAGQHRHILRYHAAGEALDTHAGEHTQRNLRADAGYLEQVAEQPPLLLGGKAIEDMGILAHHQVRDQADDLTDGGQVQERRHGRFELIAHSAHIQRDRRGGLGGDSTVQETDQLATSSRRRRLCAWHSAAASASPASGPGRSESCSSTFIMCATWVFSAAPEPTTASLMARGAYSNTAVPVGTAHSAAPRAWPSFIALSTLRLTNTRSMATSSGR